jgi:PKD repeat protein
VQTFRKVASGLIILLLLSSAVALRVNVESAGGQAWNGNSIEKKISTIFPFPTIEEKDGYDWLTIENCSYITTPGYPMLPVKTLMVKLPLGSAIAKVNVDIKQSFVQGNFQVLPASIPVTSDSQSVNRSLDLTIYGSNELFPKNSCLYHEAQGIDPETETRVEYLVLNVFPLQYLPTEKTIIRAEEMTITIQYRPPVQAFSSSVNSLQNLIITSPTLEPYALTLASWKNSTGIPSKVVNTTWIYRMYAGLDNPERIRNCIKDLVSTYSSLIYVTIFGDVDQVPIRYAYVNDSGTEESNVPTDLYYADLDGTWDDNSDGIFADQQHDSVDGIPDVYVGRIPVSKGEYAQAVVNKIIGYQQQVIYNPSPNDWTQRFILSAGTCSADGFSNVDDEGFAILKDFIGSVVDDKNLIKLYEKYNNLSTDAMKSEINKGALFLNFAGHGDPGTGLISAGWLFYWTIPGIVWNGFGISDAQSLSNGYKLPVVTAMSCSTARLDDTDCLGEWFVGNPNGGAIAYFGATRKAYGYFDEWAPYFYMGAMDSLIYETYSENQTRLGQLWGESIRKYCQSNILDYQSASMYNVKTLMETILLGDPTIDVSGDLTPPVTYSFYDGQWHNEDFSISLVGTDAGSGVAETYYRINNGPTEALSISGQPRITSEGSNNILEYWSIDEAGNVEEPHKILTDIKLDKSAPTGSLIIDNGANYTTSESVVLSLTSTDYTSGIYEMRFSNDGVWDTEPWEAPVYTKDWNLTSEEGLKTVYYQIEDVAGLQSTTYLDTIRLDTTPAQGSIIINDGADYTNSTIVNIALSATDEVSGVNQMRFSNDNITWSNWESYSNTKSWNLQNGDGTKSVFVQFQNYAGLISLCNGTIVLDTVMPVADAGQTQTANAGADVSFDGSNSLDNIGLVSYLWDFGDGTYGTGRTATHVYLNSRVYTVKLTVQDMAGNTDSDTTTVNVQAPQPSPSPSPSPSPKSTPTISPSPSPTPVPSNTPKPTLSPSPKPTSTPMPPQERPLILYLITIVVALAVVGFAAFMIKRRRLH